MAEFENGYCTGCGVKVLKWGHRPYCWRLVAAISWADPTHEFKQRCLRQMEKHWRIRQLFLVKRKHMYWQLGDDKPTPGKPLSQSIEA